MKHFACGVERVNSVEKGGTVVPCKVVFQNTKLVLENVEDASLGPIVQEVSFSKITASV